MRRFELLEPRTLAEACAHLADDPEARAIGGGTALLILIKQGVYLPATLVNLRKIPDEAGIALDGGWLRIGAQATLGDVERDPIVRERYPVLARACHVVANVRIRNMATVGGNLAHGDLQSDPPGALVALGAQVELVAVGGRRQVALADFLLGGYETALEPGELVAAVRLPPMEPGWSGAYLKFTTRSSEDRPCAGVTAMLRLDGDRCVDARLVVGAVNATPARIVTAERLAAGRTAGPDLFAEMAAVVGDALDPVDDWRASASYKRRIAMVLAERALAAGFANRGVA